MDANPGYDFEFGFHADVSPDGERIVYTTCQYPTGPPSDRRSFGYEIATINLDGSEPQRLTHDENFDHFPVRSPDGSTVLFASGGGWHDPQWFVRDLAPGADPAPTTSSIGDGLPAGEEVYPYPPKRSPSGKRVAILSAATALYGWSPNGFDADFLPARTDLYVNVVEQDEDAAPVRVSETPGGFAWSPNGDYLALAKPRGDDGIDLAIVAIDGPDEEVLVSYGNPAGYSGLLFIDPVAWSPNGQHILFLCIGVCFFDLDGNVVGRSPSWVVGEQSGDYAHGWPERAQAAWSHDGSRIAVRAPGNQHSDGSPVLLTMAVDGSDVQVLASADAEGGLTAKGPGN